MEALPDISTYSSQQFEQICRALDIGRGDDEYHLANDVWMRTIQAVAARGLSTDTPEISARMEEALVQWVLSRRLVAALAEKPLYQHREAGGGKGTDVVHPGVESLSRTYERHRYVMDELVGNRPRGSLPVTGLAKEAREALKGTEETFEHCLGVGPGGLHPFCARNTARPSDSGDGDPGPGTVCRDIPEDS